MDIERDNFQRIAGQFYSTNITIKIKIVQLHTLQIVIMKS